MCLGCGDEYFDAHERPELTEAMRKLAAEIALADMDCALTYSGLHIVIGDWNLQDDHIRYCLDQQEVPLTGDQRSIGERLLGLGEAERYAVMSVAERHVLEHYHASPR